MSFRHGKRLLRFHRSPMADIIQLILSCIYKKRSVGNLYLLLVPRIEALALPTSLNEQRR